ncbi:hypothetical protein BDZ90DRAFT_46737 [Jaminaea rosea]|uniref:Uncharacterized protein n=1 Tax=Jaminaea rosea TaxID=1569628 RepID=A0A316UQN1_9BASI|nr:hypothetical protein BDZ90DRAFT_46737 [Jaminaea rosea]PWN26173.1 hypothetical protein BDZ90DRAFT_46737 [Jaminaea rosea]
MPTGRARHLCSSGRASTCYRTWLPPFSSSWPAPSRRATSRSYTLSLLASLDDVAALAEAPAIPDILPELRLQAEAAMMGRLRQSCSALNSDWRTNIREKLGKSNKMGNQWLPPADKERAPIEFDAVLGIDAREGKVYYAYRERGDSSPIAAHEWNLIPDEKLYTPTRRVINHCRQLLDLAPLPVFTHDGAKKMSFDEHFELLGNGTFPVFILASMCRMLGVDKKVGLQKDAIDVLGKGVKGWARVDVGAKMLKVRGLRSTREYRVNTTNVPAVVEAFRKEQERREKEARKETEEAEKETAKRASEQKRDGDGNEDSEDSEWTGDSDDEDSEWE